MSGPPRVRSMNVADSEVRPVLSPTGNKKAVSLSARKPSSKPLRKVEQSPEKVSSGEEKKGVSVSTISALSPKSHSVVPSVLRRHEQLYSNLSLNASCSSDASTDSFHSRASTGRLIRSNSLGSRRKQHASKPRSVASDGGYEPPLPCDGSLTKKSCAWVTPNTDPCYAAFHDEEWGVPVHDDKKLFELLVLSSALAELTWPAILSKRHTFREVFADFDPVVVSKFNEKKMLASGSTAISLLSEAKLRAVVENARQISKVIDEYGSFDKYIWGFVNNKPIVNRFRYPRQVPVKTPKAEVISKEMVRRGFRSVGPTVVYSFMQVAGITNDHLVSCFRFQECVNAAEGKEENGNNMQDNDTSAGMESKISMAIDELSFSSE